VLVVGGAAGVWGGAVHLPAPHASPGAETVDVYWMSGVIENEKACVGPAGLHPPPYYDAYDLIADDGGDSCFAPDESQPELMQVRLRALGYSSVPHVTLGAYIVSGQYDDNCDYMEAQTVQHPSGGLRGTYRYVHVQGPSYYWIDIAAGRNLPRTDVPIGTTTHDSDCQGGAGWDGHHAHQDARFNVYSTPNPSLPVNDDIPVWNVFYYIHRWTYPLLDTDGDGFTDAAEQYLGTDALDNCPDGSWDDAWPLDINKSRDISVTGDIFKYVGRIGAKPGQPKWWQRLDLDASGDISVTGDVFLYVGRLGEKCI